MPPRKKTTTTPKAKAKTSKTPTSKQPAKKPSVKKTATKKPTTKTSGKTTTTTPPKRKTTPKKPVTTRKKPITRKKPEPKPTFKRKELTPEQMFPYETFTYRLEYQDGTEHRVCHFQCEEHRIKHIERYKLKKGTYYIDTPSS